jgi:hypothetical protein
LQTIAHIHAESYRAWTLVLSELNIAGDQPQRRIDRDHVASQSEDHALWLDRSEAIPEKDLIERYDIGLHRAVTCGLGLRLCCINRSKDH